MSKLEELQKNHLTVKRVFEIAQEATEACTGSGGMVSESLAPLVFKIALLTEAETKNLSSPLFEMLAE